jgi:urease subunit alpha
MRPMFGAFGHARGEDEPGLRFAAGRPGEGGCALRAAGAKWWRCSTAAASSKRDMKHNDALPVIEVDPETYEVRADGVL